jgi:hypothetical protein
VTVHLSRLPFALDPLIAEAKRRARQRRLLVALGVVLLAALAPGLTLALRSPGSPSAGGGGPVFNHASFNGAAKPPVTPSGLRLNVPAGWQAVVSKTRNCDPQRLLVASSAPVRIAASGRVAAPGRTAVLVLLLEDRHIRPLGDLRRPAHFSVRWNRLVRVQGCGGLPARGFIRYFKSHGRYLGFIVYPGARVPAPTRAKTLALMDSLRVNK